MSFLFKTIPIEVDSFLQADNVRIVLVFFRQTRKYIEYTRQSDVGTRHCGD